MSVDDSEHKTIILILECAQQESCSVIFEPYGGEHVLRRSDRFRIVISGPGSGEVAVWHGPGAISVMPWEGGDYITVTTRDGQVLET